VQTSFTAGVDTSRAGRAPAIFVSCLLSDMRKIIVHKLLAPRSAEGKNVRVGFSVVGNVQAAQKRWSTKGRVPSLELFCTERQWNMTYSPAAQKRAKAAPADDKLEDALMLGISNNSVRNERIVL